MARRKLPYGEGDWFALPLQNGGYALGLAARVDGRGGVLGYFFGPPLGRMPTVEDARDRRPGDARLVTLFGDLGLLNGEWTVLGRLAGWRREDWPVPVFGRISRLRDWVHAWRVHYDDASLREVWAQPCEPAEAEGLWPDGDSGYVAIQIQLERILGTGSATAAQPAPGIDASRRARASEDLFDDDVAADARGVFVEALEAGLSGTAAADRVLEEMRHSWEDTDDEPVLMLALACLLKERGVESHPAVHRARQVVATGAGLERWREAGPEFLAAREKLYRRLAAALG